MVKLPNRFHIELISINTRHGINTFEIKLEVRDLMKIYRMLAPRNETHVSNKIKMFLNSYADCYGYKNFNINDNISLKRVGVNDD